MSNIQKADNLRILSKLIKYLWNRAIYNLSCSIMA